MLNDIPDDFVPSSNHEMVKVFKQFVGFIVRKYNRVDTNYDDLLQHVWQKLIEVDVIGKYKSSGNFPKEITGEQAAAYCQVTFAQFKVAIWRGTRNNTGREKHTWMPTPVVGGWSSRKAMYSTEDIEMLLSSGFFRKKHKTDYICPRSRCKFKPYLAKSIHNIWSNWCRTRSRKYKEQYLAPMEDGTPWESLASDPFAASPETAAELSNIIDKLDKSGGGGRRVEIGQLLAQGRNLSDIVNELSLPKSMLRLRG
jgi:hypothetical protein